MSLGSFDRTANLARLEMTIMIERFGDCLPAFRVDPARPPTWKPRGDTFRGEDWIGLKMREASVVRGIGVLPVFAGVIGLLLLVGALAATWAREGR